MPTTARPHRRAVTLAAAALPVILLGTACGSDAEAKAALRSVSAACTTALTPIDPSDGNAASLAHTALAAKRAAAGAKKDSAWASTSSDFASLDTAMKRTIAAVRVARVERTHSSMDAFTRASDADGAARKKVASRCVQVRKKGGRVDPALVKLGLNPTPDTVY